MSNMIPHNTVFGYKLYLPSAIRAGRLWVSVASYSGRRGRGGEEKGVASKQSHAHVLSNVSLTKQAQSGVVCLFHHAVK